MQENYTSRDAYGDKASERQVCDETSSASELEECAASTRQSVDRTIRTLKSRLTPERVWARVRENLHRRRKGSRRPLGLNRTVGRNPAPFIILGSGLAVMGASMAVFAITKRRGAKRGRKAEDDKPDLRE